MSNEYKDWLWDHVQDLAIERGLVDTITDVAPNDPAEGQPQYIWGLKNGQKVKYYINYDPDFGYLYEHRELDHFD